MPSTITGVVRNVAFIRGADDAFPNEDVTGGKATAIKRAVVYFDHNAQSVASGDTLRVDAKAAIQNALRNGRTVTLQSVAIHGCAHDGTNPLGMKTVAISSQYIQGIPTTDDYSTGAAIANTATLKRPYSMFVGYTDV